MTITQKYYNHFTGEKRIAKREKFSGALKKQHNVDLQNEVDPDLRPLPINTYSSISDPKLAKGSMIWLDEPGMQNHLLSRGNTIDEIIQFYTDIIKACEKFNVELTPRFNRIKKELGI